MMGRACCLVLSCVLVHLVQLLHGTEQQTENKNLSTIILNGNYSDYYTFNVNRTVEYIFQFPASEDMIDKPARITVECKDSNRSFPVLVVVRQQKGVLSWQLPLLVETESDSVEYWRTSRTLCPDNSRYFAGNNVKTLYQYIIVSISTASNQNLSVSLLVSRKEDFRIRLSDTRNITVLPAEPQYFAFRFPQSGPDTVLLRVDSDSQVCMMVSIQNMSCPVFDLEQNVHFEGFWETVNVRGGITLPRDAFPLGFYVVFVVKGDDVDCSGPDEPIIKPRNKTLSFSLSPSITYQKYLVAACVAIAAFALFYIFSIAISVVYLIRVRRSLPSTSDVLDDECTLPSVFSPGSESTSTIPRAASDSSLDETDIDVLHDAEMDKDIFRTKTVLYVADLARKDPRILRQKSQLYLWNLLTVAVFYSLPVVQLVITYQLVLDQTGNQDLCYYNFLCAHPFGLLSDFNHIFSNLGYILLGLLFIILTARRDRMHRCSDSRFDKYYGIPQHYGLFYAMGAALMMEGVLSACYHVCPNHSNFQFDTSFMYVIAMLCMLKIYQTRHPDINASAYSTFGVLACVILIGMAGVLKGGVYFWIGFTCLHLITCLVLSVQIYYMGRWTLDFSAIKRVFVLIYFDLRASPLHCIRPLYPNRMVLLTLGNLCNIALAVLGLKYHLRDFATYLLSIFMANLLLYTFFYIVMKLCHRERILVQPLLYIILSFASWGAALYFFFNKSISWALTPAQSRQYNQPCEILDFYDKHDIWHFLSAASMFFSFMVLLTLDDDLIDVHRSKIPVF
ncbi:SID1 transmembrane family member 1-like [Schistocerca americana]|uniref:SID1 transmembrane family member 1-like n=1 Tax=Schistocerca americana TaxID=7009 RepID=UPI001F501C21|nr:SID1 transmembrane family member 1-like [Schistocerca americana]XP_047098834.1 SID1 transmembrane family member 1-like [Schistocerca piceifrons]